MKNTKNAVAEFIKNQINEKGIIDVSCGVETKLCVSAKVLNDALYSLANEGYPLYAGRIRKGSKSRDYDTFRVICPPGTEYKDIYNRDRVNIVG